MLLYFLVRVFLNQVNLLVSAQIWIIQYLQSVSDIEDDRGDPDDLGAQSPADGPATLILKHFCLGMLQKNSTNGQDNKRGRGGKASMAWPLLEDFSAAFLTMALKRV